MMLETYIVEAEGVTASRIIWQRFQKPMPGLLERVLVLNPTLADQGPILPVGYQIVLPIDAPDETERSVPSIRLW